MNVKELIEILSKMNPDLEVTCSDEEGNNPTLIYNAELIWVSEKIKYQSLDGFEYEESDECPYCYVNIS